MFVRLIFWFVVDFYNAKVVKKYLFKKILAHFSYANVFISVKWSIIKKGIKKTESCYEDSVS